MMGCFPNISSTNPEKPSQLNIKVTNRTPYVGDTVTVTLSEIPYEEGAYLSFGGDVYYGTKQEKENAIPATVDYILEDWHYRQDTEIWKENTIYYATFSFAPQQSGLATIDVFCHRRYDVTFASTQINILVNPNSDGSSTVSDSTPSFELVFALCAIGIALFLWRKKLGI